MFRGYVFPIANMPLVIQLAHLPQSPTVFSRDPARDFLQGVGIQILTSLYVALAILGTALFTGAVTGSKDGLVENYFRKFFPIKFKIKFSKCNYLYCHLLQSDVKILYHQVKEEEYSMAKAAAAKKPAAKKPAAKKPAAKKPAAKKPTLTKKPAAK